MKKIKLTKNKYAIVDDEDFNFLSQWKWGYSTSGYARRLQYVPSTGYGHKNNTAIRIWMHRLINKTPDNLFTDHINQNKLDNRKSNLRTVTKSQNSINTGKNKKNKSGFKGVYFDTWSNKWRAELKIKGKKITLGRFFNIEEALKSRLLAEQKYHVI